MTSDCETYLVGVDYSDGEDETMLNVIRKEGDRLTVIKTVFGKEAEDLYEHLTGKSIRENNLHFHKN